MNQVLDLFLSTLRVSTPLIFAALGGFFSERSGVINIALEGFMLMGAFIAAVATLMSGSPWVGFCAAASAGALYGLCYAFFTVRLKLDQIVAGTAFNFLAMGLIPFALKVLYGSTGASPTIPIEHRFQIFPVYIAFAAVPAAAYFLHRLPAGLWLSFAGEHPEALEAAGVSVRKVRLSMVSVAGALAAMGGACLSIFLSSGYSRNMSAGRGFMALAALIFGKWRPTWAAAACLLFGFLEALQFRLQSVDLARGAGLPPQFIQALPYLATMIVLAGFVGKARAPKALGR